MKNRITVKVYNQEYRLLADEDPVYIQKCANLMERGMQGFMQGPRLALLDGAVLSGLNIADLYFKEKETADNLRHQLKEALDDVAQMEHELVELRRERIRSRGKNDLPTQEEQPSVEAPRSPSKQEGPPAEAPHSSPKQERPQERPGRNNNRQK